MFFPMLDHVLNRRIIKGMWLEACDKFIELDDSFSACFFFFGHDACGVVCVIRGGAIVASSHVLLNFG